MEDINKIQAAKFAGELWRWRSDFELKYYHPNHDCALMSKTSNQCEIVEIKYEAFIIPENNNIFVQIINNDNNKYINNNNNKKKIINLIPIFGCLYSGNVHLCKSQCDQGDSLTCPISGIEKGIHIVNSWVLNDGRPINHAWKLNPFQFNNKFRATETLDIRDQIESDKYNTFQDINLIQRTRIRPWLNGKPACFDVAFSIAVIILNRKRFIQDIVNNREKFKKMIGLSKKIILRNQSSQNRNIINIDATSILNELPEMKYLPIFLYGNQVYQKILIRIADHCVALWYLIRENIHKNELNKMSFRDFCVAAIKLFSRGHNLPHSNILTGLDQWIIERDFILHQFPINQWVQKKIYYNRSEEKIIGIIRRAETRLIQVINHYILDCCGSPTDLRYMDLLYESIPVTEVFNRVKC